MQWWVNVFWTYSTSNAVLPDWNAPLCDVLGRDWRHDGKWIQVCVQQDLLQVSTSISDGLEELLDIRWCRIKRLVSERIPGQSLRKAKKLRDEVLNEESYMPGSEISIPIILCVLAIVLYLIMGSAIFHVWEEWDLPSAAYFCFITLSTVGFGDMVPTRSFLGYEESLYGKFQMFVCVTYCAMGLAVLATAMSLIQVRRQSCSIVILFLFAGGSDDQSGANEKENGSRSG